MEPLFDHSGLKHLGDRVIIGRTVRVRYPALVEIGDDSVIDDFGYLSTSLAIGRAVHVGPHAAFLGGRDSRIEIGDGASVSANVTLAGANIPRDSIKGYSWFEGALSGSSARATRVVVGRFAVIGAGTVLSESVTVGEGALVGANSFVNADVPPWEIWAGAPARRVADRSEYRESLLAMWDAFAQERYGTSAD